MNVWKTMKDRNFVVYGTGYWGGIVANDFESKIDYFIDSDPAKWDMSFHGKKVKSPSVLREDVDVFVVVASDVFYREISQKIVGYGIPHYNFAIFFALYPFEKFSEKYPVRRLLIEATNSCNSHCTMCNMWKNPPNSHIPNEIFETVSKDEFFLNLRHLRISGGEPTVNPRLVNLIQSACENFPAIETIVLNLNGLAVGKTMRDITDIADITRKYGIETVVSLSLNGVGEAHDGNRGVPGNFGKCVEVIDAVKELQKTTDNLSLQISGRIVRQNVWNTEEFIYWLEKNDLKKNYILLAGRMNALYNDEYEGADTFNADELYEIRLAFHKMPIAFGYDEYLKWTYDIFIDRFNKSKNKAAFRKSFAVCCGEKGEDIAIRATGYFSYCQAAPAVGQYGLSCRTIYDQNINELKYMGMAKCDSCYFCSAWVNETVWYKDYKNELAYWHGFFTLDAYRSRRDFVLKWVESPKSAIYEVTDKIMAERAQYTAIITGWYGTETVGDKAILGQIISEIRGENPAASIQITSAYPFITERTLYELGETAEVIPLFGEESLNAASRANVVIMGGGPLMEMEWLAIPLWLFSIAKQAGHKTVVRGCGIGPVKTEKGEKAIAEILSLADEITVRDNASAEIARKMTGCDDITVTGDPAIPYLRANYGGAAKGVKNDILACFLREITDEYYSGTHEEYLCFREEFEKALAGNIKKLCEVKNLRPYFYSMHNFVIGGDDRDFAYRFVDEQGFEKGNYDIYNKLTSVDVVADAMLNADLCLCMRFHSTVFADTLDVRYLSIDYTGGGKIKGFLDDKGKIERLVNIGEIECSADALVERAKIYDV